VLLMMTVYGFGAAEVRALRLDGVDWRARVIRFSRPKTATAIELPLLPVVARALIAYLRKARPTDSANREIFLSARLPRRPLTSGAIGHIVRIHARAAGLDVPVGSHVLRHSHATRQVDAGVSLKMVGDILGHRRPSSTSVYARVALRRLRQVALPVPG
jgi:integrase